MDSGADAAAPPVAGLGNYKGVMLCNRPSDESHHQGGGLAGGAQPAFKSTVSVTHNEVLGLCPSKGTKQMNPLDLQVKNRGPSAALRRHCKWLKELQESVKQNKEDLQAGSDAQGERQKRMHEVFKAQRDAVRQLKSQRDAGQLDRDELMSMMGSAGAKKSAASGGPKKPMWAMTEAEKDDAEDEDAAELIKFAEDLDFDSYVGDLEFRQCLQAIRDRAKRLQREQDSFKAQLVSEFNATFGDDGDSAEPDHDAPSVAGSGGPGGTRRLRAGNSVDRPEWDASTACSDPPATDVDREAQSLAKSVMESNSQLRAIHSKGSIQKLVQSAQGSQPASEYGA